jgi:hypothetical protein
MKPAQPINQPPAAGFRRVTAGRRAHSRCAGGQRGETHFAGVFRGGDSAPAAARRLLARLLGVVQDCRAAAAKGAAPDVLHDLRVGLRRFRTALRFLAPHLPPSAARIHRSLAELSAALSPLRDEEIWNAFLCRP